MSGKEDGNINTAAKRERRRGCNIEGLCYAVFP
jgi:hypothetical protein